MERLKSHTMASTSATEMNGFWLASARQGSCCGVQVACSSRGVLDRRQKATIILRCQQVTQPAQSPLQLLGKTIRGTMGGRVPHAQQQVGSKPRTSRGSVRGGTTASQKQRGTANRSERGKGRFYWNFTGFPFPLGPLLRRRTIRYELDRGRIWLFEQEQALGFSNVTTNVRMTIIKLRSGGLWVHAPIAPTRECIALVKELGCPVEHIVLPTFAVEHKLFVGPFSRAFPAARVHVAPRQWSWPLWLPVQAFGIFPASVLVNDDASTPWADEIEQKIFASAVGIGPFSEVAFFHKPSRTLLVTDAVISVPERAPEVVREASLLEAGGPLPASVRALSGGDAESPTEEIFAQNTEQQLQLGWQRMALQILYFVPYNLLQPAPSFAAVSRKLLVSPVLKKLVFLNSPDESRRWIEDIASSWPFRRIIPAHFSAPIAATPQDLRAAFAFVYKERVPQPQRGLFARWFGGAAAASTAEFPATDMRALDGLERILRRAGVLNQ